jgi:hypothetical protein
MIEFSRIAMQTTGKYITVPPSGLAIMLRDAACRPAPDV